MINIETYKHSVPVDAARAEWVMDNPDLSILPPRAFRSIGSPANVATVPRLTDESHASPPSPLREVPVSNTPGSYRRDQVGGGKPSKGVSTTNPTTFPLLQPSAFDALSKASPRPGPGRSAASSSRGSPSHKESPRTDPQHPLHPEIVTGSASTRSSSGQSARSSSGGVHPSAAGTRTPTPAERTASGERKLNATIDRFIAGDAPSPAVGLPTRWGVTSKDVRSPAGLESRGQASTRSSSEQSVHSSGGGAHSSTAGTLASAGRADSSSKGIYSGLDDVPPFAGTTHSSATGAKDITWEDVRLPVGWERSSGPASSRSRGEWSADTFSEGAPMPGEAPLRNLMPPTSSTRTESGGSVGPISSEMVLQRGRYSLIRKMEGLKKELDKYFAEVPKYLDKKHGDQVRAQMVVAQSALEAVVKSCEAYVTEGEEALYGEADALAVRTPSVANSEASRATEELAGRRTTNQSVQVSRRPQVASKIQLEPWDRRRDVNQRVAGLEDPLRARRPPVGKSFAPPPGGECKLKKKPGQGARKIAGACCRTPKVIP